MNRGQLRELFLCRMYLEMQLFKEGLFYSGKEDIFEVVYQNEIMVKFYEILVGEIERMPDAFLRKMLSVRESILETLYQGLRRNEDNTYAELEEYVCSVFEGIYEEEEGECSWKNILYDCSRQMK